MENLGSVNFLHDHFSGRRAFITGHTGFKGSWLAACLHYLGAVLKGYALSPEYKDGIFDVVTEEKIIESVYGDVRDKKRLRKEIHEFKPDFVFHLAAQPLVRKSYALPAETFEVNAVGTANLLEVIMELASPCVIIVVTTDKVYENLEIDYNYSEVDRLGGYDPYSASKACAELICESFRRSFFNISTYNLHGKAIATARAGNVIGGGDLSSDRIVPDIIRALSHNEVIELRNPDSVRPWQHVLEPINGYLKLASLLSSDPEKYSKPFNFGPYDRDHLTVRALTELAIRSWGEGSWKDVSNSAQLHEARVLKLNISRAVKELAWKPRLSAADAIAWSIEWYKSPYDRRRKLTYDQIEKYFDL